MKIYRYSLLAVFSISIFSLLIFSNFSYVPATGGDRSASSGELSFTVRTVAAGGNYAPRHVLAIWIQENDEFVKTRKAMAGQRIQYLYTWAAASNYNVVDAITGPTLLTHQTHTVTWDCTDLSGNVVPDGEYTVYAEFTDQHSQGPLYSINFTKGVNPQFMSPPDQTYFKDIVLTFTPIICDFSANDTVLCYDNLVTFTDESVNATSWEWDFGEGATPASASTEGPHEVAYSSTGEKTISLTINGNLTETKEGYILIENPPLADFAFSGNDMEVNFTNTSVNALSYLWDFGDGNTSIEINPSHTYASAGTYEVSLTASHANCDDDTIQTVMVPMVGLEEIYNKNLVRVFPNPNDGRFYINTNDNAGISKISLFNASGQLVWNKVNESFNESAIIVDLKSKESGIYFLEIVSEKETFIKKVLIR